MGHSELVLTAIQPLPDGDWRAQALESLQAAGYHAEAQGAGLVAWGRIQPGRGFDYADGWSLRREWLGPRRHAVCVLPRRLYFAPEGTLDTRPEYFVVRSQKPPSPAQSEQIERLWGVASDVLAQLGNSQGRLVPLESLPDISPSLRQMDIRDQEFVEPNGRLTAIYNRVGFDTIPDNLTFTVCPTCDVSEERAAAFAAALKNSAGRTGTQVTVRSTSEEKVRQHLGQGGVRVSATPGRCLVFLLPPKGRPHEPDLLSLMRELDDFGIPYRRAYSDDPFQHSTSTQLPSLLMAAGGVPHRTPHEAAGESLWTVGVDLGHPIDSPTSTLALTLVDPDGRLQGAWTFNQPRDETARPDSLERLLEPCAKRLESIQGDARVVVLRDGRTFENERASVYAPYFPGGMSLVELRKGNNPQMVSLVGRPQLPEGPVAGTIPGTSTMFLTTLSARGLRMLPSVIKVVARPEANGLDLDLPAIAELLVRSAAAPSLGTWPHHLPAAIYWADGIAGRSDTDLRFWGTIAARID